MNPFLFPHRHQTRVWDHGFESRYLIFIVGLSLMLSHRAALLSFWLQIFFQSVMTTVHWNRHRVCVHECVWLRACVCVGVCAYMCVCACMDVRVWGPYMLGSLINNEIVEFVQNIQTLCTHQCNGERALVQTLWWGLFSILKPPISEKSVGSLFDLNLSKSLVIFFQWWELNTNNLNSMNGVWMQMFLFGRSRVQMLKPVSKQLLETFIIIFWRRMKV